VFPHHNTPAASLLFALSLSVAAGLCSSASRSGRVLRNRRRGAVVLVRSSSTRSVLASARAAPGRNGAQQQTETATLTAAVRHERQPQSTICVDTTHSGGFNTCPVANEGHPSTIRSW